MTTKPQKTKKWSFKRFSPVPVGLTVLALCCLAFVERRLNEADVLAPANGEACFSPDGGCDVKLWKFLQSAQKSIDIAVFDLTHEKITHEIAVAAKRIDVRVVVDRRQAKGEHNLVSTLIKAGVNVKYGVQRGIMHNKFVIVDGARLETGSFNFTGGASERNQENQIYLADAKVVAQYRERFEKIWENAADPNAKSKRDSRRRVSSGAR